MTYRIYYGGGEREHAWIIQTVEGQEVRTVATAREVFLFADCTLAPQVEGPKPNGYLLVNGKLEIKDGVATIHKP